MGIRRQRSSGDRKPPRSPSPWFKPILLKIGHPPLPTSLIIASPTLSTEFSSLDGLDGEADPGHLQIFLVRLNDLLARKQLLVFMIKVEVEMKRFEDTVHSAMFDFLLAEDPEVARALAVEEYGPAARISRIDTDKWRELQRIESEIRVRARNLDPLTQMDQLAGLYHRFERAVRALYAVCDACGEVLDTREGRLLTPDEAHALGRRHCRGGKCGSRARTRAHRERHPEHKVRRR
jgi:hypothetical protein